LLRAAATAGELHRSTAAGATLKPEGTANPLPLLPAVDLLEPEGQAEAARRVSAAVGRVLTERRALTPDLGGKVGTAAMTQAIIAALA
jgi:isocitrate/isopropylmalate dehydrogenase